MLKQEFFNMKKIKDEKHVKVIAGVFIFLVFLINCGKKVEKPTKVIDKFQIISDIIPGNGARQIKMPDICKIVFDQ
jgi:hypothetical protein